MILAVGISQESHNKVDHSKSESVDELDISLSKLLYIYNAPLIHV